MTLRTVRILQIGSVDWDMLRALDPDSLKAKVASRPTIILRKLIQLLRGQDFVVVLGEHGSDGRFLNELQRWTKDQIPPERVWITPEAGQDANIESVGFASLPEQPRVCMVDGNASVRLIQPDQVNGPPAWREVAEEFRWIPNEGLPVILSRGSLDRSHAMAGAAGPATDSHLADLFECDRPFLSLHGAAVDDLIRVIVSSERGLENGKLISIGAPPLNAGFNTIHVVFNPDGIPIGILAERWRCHESPQLECFSGRFSLWTGARALLESVSRQARDLYQQLPAEVVGRELVVRNATGEFDLTPPPGLEMAMREGVEELEWHGLVVVENRDLTFPCWTIRKGI